MHKISFPLNGQSARSRLRQQAKVETCVDDRSFAGGYMIVIYGHGLAAAVKASRVRSEREADGIT